MAGPPAAAWTVRRGARAHLLVCAMAVLCGALSVTTYVVYQPWGWPSAITLVVLGACVFMAGLGLRRECTGTLVWDGSHWRADWTDGEIGDVRCVLDFQQWMLLSVRTTASEGFWLWAESDAMRTHWLSFRRAVVSAGVAAPPKDSPVKL